MNRFLFSARCVALCTFAGLSILTTGCQPSGSVSSKPTTADSHGHDHAGHDHSSDHGPNGGHLVDLAPSNSHGEWAHDDETGKITLFFTDSLKAGQKVESARIDLNVAGQEPKSYEFKGTEKGSFELESLELLTALELCSGEPDSKVTAKLVAKIDGKEESAPVVHHDHGHSH
ncbi:MAG: hypothetical protein NTW52_06630 [Planctomycetota bacterium]|nr:hypothetical protein [Planctomycetota bacterium]